MNFRSISPQPMAADCTVNAATGKPIPSDDYRRPADFLTPRPFQFDVKYDFYCRFLR